MKKILTLVILVAATTAHASDIAAAGPIKQAMIGNSAAWHLTRGKDSHSLTLTPRLPHATATNLIVETDDGLEAYDIATDGRVSRNDDQRALHDNGELEFTPARLAVIEMPGKVKRVEWTRPLSGQIQVVVDGRYIGAKYAPSPDVTITGPRRLTVTTDAGRYIFEVRPGKGGAPIYRVMSGL